MSHMATPTQAKRRHGLHPDKQEIPHTYSEEVDVVEEYSKSRHVKWGIVWYAPALMFAYAMGGLAIAIGHHFYFSSLHNTVAGTAFRQQIAIGSGTAISVTIVALLRSATCAAYNQYAWVLVRKKFYKLGTLDKLFALTTDPTGFFSMEMVKYAKVAVLLALISWSVLHAHLQQPLTYLGLPLLQESVLRRRYQLYQALLFEAQMYPWRLSIGTHMASMSSRNIGACLHRE